MPLLLSRDGGGHECSRGGALYERADDDRRTEFTQQRRGEPAAPSNRPRLESLEPERTVRDKTLEPAERHLVQPAFGNGACRLARSEGPAPAKQRGFREHYVCPREYRKQMAADRVIPRRAERCDDLAVRPEMPVHHAEDRCRIVEVFERVERDDYVGWFVGRCGEDAAIRQAGRGGGVARGDEAR